MHTTASKPSLLKCDGGQLPRHLNIQPNAQTVRNICARADRRGSAKEGSNGGSSTARKHRREDIWPGSGSDAGSGAASKAARDNTARGRELQRAARRASARLGDVGAGRLAMQERLALQAEEDSDDWAAVAAAAIGRQSGGATPLPQRADLGRGGSSRKRPGGNGGSLVDGDDEEELWPSQEAVVGVPPPASAPSRGASPAAVGAAASSADSKGRERGGATAVVGDAAGLIQALRAAQAFERQGRMLTGGSGLGAATATAGTGRVGEDDSEDLVPYVEVALKELGLPPRPLQSGRRRPSPEEQQKQLCGSSRYGRGDAEYGEDIQDEEDAAAGSRRRGSSPGPAATPSPTRGRGAKRGALRELLAAYQRVWCRALDLELQEEWVESEERLKKWRRPRLEAEGYALFDLTAAPDHNLFRDAVLRFFVPGRPLPYHCLGAGDIVLVSPNNRPGEASLEGVVLDFSGRWIRIALPADLAHGVQGSGWRLDLYANTIAHERARGAVKRYCQAAAESGSSSGNGKSSDDNSIGGSGSGGDGGAASIGILRALAGSVPPGTSLEQLAAAAPPWLRGKAGRERLTAARRVVAAAAATTAENEFSATAAAAPPPPAVAAALPVPAGVAISRGGGAVSTGGGDGGGRRRRAAGLNPSQARAIETALGRSLTLWQGPPGTGKTATLLHFIRAALAALPSGSGPLLATAASNVAVDNLVSGLRALDPSLDVVRVGQPVKVAPELRGVSLEARIAGTAAGQRAARLRRQAQGLRGAEAWTFISQALELEEGAARDILSRAQVVAATCIGCGEARMQALSFPVVVLDEATQATEPHSLVPLLSQVKQLVLVGDPQQLPPTVKSRTAAELGLQLPLFERLQLMGLSPLLLDTQYRMHPAIADFPSAAFYGGQLRSAPAPRDRRPPAAFPWPNPKIPVCFIPVRGRESRTAAANDAATPGGAAGFSYQNDEEAAAVTEVVAALLTRGSDGLDGPGDIGVVTPYNGQVRCLQQLLTRGSRLPRGPLGTSPGVGTRPGAFLRTAAAANEAPAAETRPGAPGLGLPYGSGSGSGWDRGTPERSEEPLLEVKSVDGFQGREKEVIVFSAVRSNPDGRLGFLADGRRLNVAITRARRGLVVLGNPDTLGRDRLWARWLRWAGAHGCVMAQGWQPGQPKQEAAAGAAAGRGAWAGGGGGLAAGGAGAAIHGGGSAGVYGEGGRGGSGRGVGEAAGPAVRERVAAGSGRRGRLDGGEEREGEDGLVLL